MLEEASKTISGEKCEKSEECNAQSKCKVSEIEDSDEDGMSESDRKHLCQHAK